jgi:hypothetical protein
MAILLLLVGRDKRFVHSEPPIYSIWRGFSNGRFRARMDIIIDSTTDGDKLIAAHLEGLHRLGWIRPRRENRMDGEPPWQNWRVSSPDELAEHVPPSAAGDERDAPDIREDDAGGSNNGGSGGDGGPGTPRGPDGTGGGGGGVGAVLSHPTLFALPLDEFERYTDNLFNGPGAP